MTQTHRVDTYSQLPREARRIGLLFLVSTFCFITTVSEALAASVSPNTLSYSASSSAPTPSPQTVTFSKNSIVTKSWTASGNTSWITVSPSTGTISREKDQITVNVNASGLAGARTTARSISPSEDKSVWSLSLSWYQVEPLHPHPHPAARLLRLAARPPHRAFSSIPPA